MIKKQTKRNRCEHQGCHKIAVVGFGAKGFDYYLCKEHFLELQKEIKNFKLEEPEVVVEEPVDETPRVEVLIDEPVDEHPNFEEGGEGFFTCKYCGKQFAKRDMTVGQFATHSRLCKKEHE